MDTNDKLLDAYNYSGDAALEKLRLQDRADWRVMHRYAAKFQGYGRQLTAHQNRVAKDGAAFLRHLGFNQHAAQNFRAAMLFHDIGKTHSIYEPDSWAQEDRPSPPLKILQRQHARLGAEMLMEICAELADHPHFKVRYALTRYHHERLDGAGPEGLIATEQPLFVQVACLTDAYDGDRIQRPHQAHRRTPAEALARMADQAGKYAGAFDSRLLARYKTFKESQA